MSAKQDTTNSGDSDSHDHHHAADGHAHSCGHGHSHTSHDKHKHDNRSQSHGHNHANHDNSPPARSSHHNNDNHSHGQSQDNHAHSHSSRGHSHGSHGACHGHGSADGHVGFNVGDADDAASSLSMENTDLFGTFDNFIPDGEMFGVESWLDDSDEQNLQNAISQYAKALEQHTSTDSSGGDMEEEPDGTASLCPEANEHMAKAVELYRNALQKSFADDDWSRAQADLSAVFGGRLVGQNAPESTDESVNESQATQTHLGASAEEEEDEDDEGAMPRPGEWDTARIDALLNTIKQQHKQHPLHKDVGVDVENNMAFSDMQSGFVDLGMGDEEDEDEDEEDEEGEQEEEKVEVGGTGADTEGIDVDVDGLVLELDELGLLEPLPYDVNGSNEDEGRHMPVLPLNAQDAQDFEGLMSLLDDLEVGQVPPDGPQLPE